MFLLFAFSGIAIQQDLGSEAQDQFVPLAVIGWMFSPSTPIVFPITVSFTLAAAISVGLLKLLPNSTSLKVAPAPMGNGNSIQAGGGRRLRR